VSAIIASATRVRKYFPTTWIGTLPPSTMPAVACRSLPRCNEANGVEFTKQRIVL